MAPIKFEDQVKDELEKRQIKPSHDAWNRLHRGLDDQDQSPSPKKIWWLGIAASFVGVLLLVTFFNKENSQIELPAVVETETPEPQMPIQQPKEEPEEQVVFENQIERDDSAQKPESKASLKTVELVEEETLAQTTSEADQENILQENKEAEILSFEDQKVLEVVAQIKAIQAANDRLKDIEIDALLADAQKEIELKKLYDQATHKVDAEALLELVEYDLEKSFREKVFEALKDSYRTVKTAVAERNN